MSYELRVTSQKNRKENKKIGKRENRKPQLLDFSISQLLVLCLLVTCYLSLVTAVHAEVLDRIVAIVNNNVILLSEYEEAFQAAKKSDEKVTEGRVLDEMINRLLILEQARKFRLGTTENSAETVDDDKIISEYIDRRIKSLIHIPIEEIESYYVHNKERYGDKPFYEVKDEIDEHLAEGELKIKLAEHVEELRKKAYIRIQKDPAGSR